MSQRDESNVRTFLMTLALLLVTQTGTLIWFLSSEHAERARLTQTMDRIAPEHAELWFAYTAGKKEK